MEVKTERLYDITLDLFGSEMSLSTVNLKKFSGRKEGYFEFRLTIYAHSRYNAIKKAKNILKTSSWVKSQDLLSHRNLPSDYSIIKK